MLKVLYLKQDKPQIITEINNAIIAALQCSNCDVDICDLNPIRDAALANDSATRLSLQKTALDQIQRFSPHIALGYGFRGILPIDRTNHLLNALSIPYFAICFDNLLHQQELIECCANKGNVVILGLDPDLFPLYNKVGFERCHYFPIATGFSEVNVIGQPELNQQSPPLLFVGGVSQTPPLASWLSQFSGAEKAFATFAAEAVLEKELNRQDEILRLFNEQMPEHAGCLDQADFTFQQLWFKLDKYLTSCLRINTVKAVADYGITVCGSYQGWLDGLKDTTVSFLPNVDYSSQLPQLYQATPIVINRSPLTLQNAVQQRCMDVGAVGGFILTEYRPILETHFKVGEEIAVYESLKDLRENVAFYLSHPEERQQISERLHHRVMQEHTWDHRIQWILELAGKLN